MCAFVECPDNNNNNNKSLNLIIEEERGDEHNTSKLIPLFIWLFVEVADNVE